MTISSVKAYQAKCRREELKQVESLIHPSPVINGLEILHRHSNNGDIYFSAWKNKSRVNHRELHILKRYVLNCQGNFYDAWKKEIEWLCEMEKQS